MAKKILIVDDSALMRRLACDIINSDSRFEVADMAKNGLEALDLLRVKSYDAVILDVNMPRMNGLELLKKLQEENIRPRVLMFSTQTSEGARETIEALELGAIDFIQKPEGVMSVAEYKFRDRFLTLLGVVARSFGGPRPKQDTIGADTAKISEKTIAATTATMNRLATMRRTPVNHNLRKAEKVVGEKILAVASSTGGPKALQQFIPKLPANLDAPVLLVQHMPAGFTKSLADRLDQLSELHVKEAEDGDRLEKGWVYVAAGGRHMKVGKSGNHYRIFYTDEPVREGVRPSANYMYESLMDSSFAQVCCVVMTGMGADGTVGIKNLDTKKKIHVIAQNEETCAVYGMPKSIVGSGLVNEELPLEDLAAAAVQVIGVK